MRVLSRFAKSLLPSITAVLALAGPATAASTFQVMLESDANADPGSEVYLLTYDSLADLIAGDFSSGQFTQIGISAPYSIVGFDISGGAYSLLLESDLNADPGDEVYLLTYDSLADLIAGDFSTGQFTQIGISAPYSIAGLDHDGSTYSLLLESDLNADPGDEVYLLTYNSLGELIAGDFSTGQFTQIGISAPYSIAGLLSISGAGGGDGGTVPEPGTTTLLSLGLLGLAAMRKRQAARSAAIGDAVG